MKFSDLQEGQKFEIVSPVLKGESFVKQSPSGSPDDKCSRCGTGQVWNALNVTGEAFRVHVCPDTPVEALQE